MLKWSLLFSFLLCLSKPDNAQTGPGIDTLLTGTWNGTSLCQIKNSPCHNEIVVYHISKINGTHTFTIYANKIVHGVEEEMGILPCVYNKLTKQLTSAAYGTWTFSIEGDKLECYTYMVSCIGKL